MKKLLILLIVALAACDETKVEKRPANIIPPENMAQILAEVHFLHAVHEDRFIKVNHLQDIVQLEYLQVLDSFSITASAFDSSLQWYGNQPQLLEQIYDDALEILTERQLQLSNEAANKTEKEEEISKPKSITILGKEHPIDEKGNLIKPE